MIIAGAEIQVIVKNYPIL